MITNSLFNDVERYANNRTEGVEESKSERGLLNRPSQKEQISEGRIVGDASSSKRVLMTFVILEEAGMFGYKMVLKKFCRIVQKRIQYYNRVWADSLRLGGSRGGRFRPRAVRRYRNAKGVLEEHQQGAFNVAMFQVGVHRYAIRNLNGPTGVRGQKSVVYAVGYAPADLMSAVFEQIKLGDYCRGPRYLSDGPEVVSTERTLWSVALAKGRVLFKGLTYQKRFSQSLLEVRADFRQAASTISSELERFEEVIASKSADFVSGRGGGFMPTLETLGARCRKLKTFIVYKPAKHNQPSLSVITKREDEIAKYRSVGLEFTPAPLVGNYTIVTPRLLFRVFGMRPVEFLSVEFQAAFERRLESFDENHVAMLGDTVLTGSSLRPYEEREALSSSTIVADLGVGGFTPTEVWDLAAAEPDPRVVVKKHKPHKRINYSSHEAVAAARIKFPYVDGLLEELVGPRNLAIRHYLSEKLVELGWRVVDIASHLDEFVLVVNLPSSQVIAVRDLTNSSAVALRKAAAKGVGGKVSV